jgi:hypothetical protein
LPLEFAATNSRRPGWVRYLNIPTYIFAFLAGVAFPYWQPYAFFLVSLLTGLVYSYILHRAMRSFFRIQPPRPVWQLIVPVFLAQVAVLVAALYLLSA